MYNMNFKKLETMQIVEREYAISKKIETSGIITIKYEDTFGNQIAPEERTFGILGEKVNLLNYKKEIENYKLVESPENQELKKEDCIVKYKYSLKTKIKFVFLNNDTNESINDEIIKETYIGDDIEIPKIDIDGYDLITNEETIKIDNENKIFEIRYEKKKQQVKKARKKEETKKEEIQYKEIRITYKDFATNKILLQDRISVRSDQKTIKYKTKRIEGYKPMDEEEKSIINEIINSLNEQENKKYKEEYEIVMNCDKSDYIVYYKK